MAPVADSPLERAGFEPSVPRWGNYAHETVPFDRYSISRPFSGAAQRIDRCFRRGFGIYELYRQMAEEQTTRESARIAAPHPMQQRHEAILAERQRYAALMTDRPPTAEEAATHVGAIDAILTGRF